MAATRNPYSTFHSMQRNADKSIGILTLLCHEDFGDSLQCTGLLKSYLQICCSSMIKQLSDLTETVNGDKLKIMKSIV